MRLTVDLLERVVPHVNPVREWELQLRGCKIPAIENTGGTKDQYDCMDLSDNQIQNLGNFARLNRLVTLLLNNNPITRVAPDIGTQLPKLETLILTNCKVASLTVVDNIGTLRRITHLSLVGNPVTRVKNYRLYAIHRMPTLRSLDFCRVKQKERDAAAALFASAEGRALEATVSKAKTFKIGQVVSARKEEETVLLPEERAAFEAALAETTTPEEVDKVERMLKAGAFRKKVQATS